jgi:hypothetical protein
MTPVKTESAEFAFVQKLHRDVELSQVPGKVKLHQVVFEELKSGLL